jgi:uncharacterized membrane protein HdeD (DUF308 family)
MAPGIVLIIIGAVFTFALRSDGTWINTRILGVILILGGLAFIWRARSRRRVTVTRETQRHGRSGETEERTVKEQRME